MRYFFYRLANQLFESCYLLYHPLYLCWKALTDMKERAFIRKFVGPGMVVADVGANIGIYTLYLSRLTCGTGQVHAFEPSPRNFQRLRSNVAGLGNVVLNNSAIGDRKGSIHLYLSDLLNVDHRTYDSNDGSRRIDVPVTRLDDYFTLGARVDFIKVDVQGFELSVLRGATRILSENHGIRLLIEYWPYGLMQASVSPQEVIEFAESLGFYIMTTNGVIFDSRSMLSSAVIDEHKYWNLILSRSPCI